MRTREHAEGVLTPTIVAQFAFEARTQAPGESENSRETRGWPCSSSDNTGERQEVAAFIPPVCRRHKRPRQTCSLESLLAMSTWCAVRARLMGS